MNRTPPNLALWCLEIIVPPAFLTVTPFLHLYNGDNTRAFPWDCGLNKTMQTELLVSFSTQSMLHKCSWKMGVKLSVSHDAGED